MSNQDILLRLLFPISPYNNRAERERARLVYTVVTLMILAPIAFSVTGFDVVITGLPLLLLLLIASYTLTRIGRLRIASLALILNGGLGLGLGLAANAIHPVIQGIALLMILLLATALLPPHGLWLGGVLSLAALVMGMQQRELVAPGVSDSLVFQVLIVLLLALAVRFFMRNWRPESSPLSADEANERIRVAEITARVIGEISSSRHLKATLNAAVDNIVANYPTIYHAQIFLVDDTRRRALLRASTGEVGNQLLGLQYTADINDKNLVGVVVETGHAYIEHIDPANTYQRNPYLLSTRVEAVLPLIVGSTVIGVLDLHSEWPAAFPDEVLPILQTLAAHTAMSIENARLFEEAARQIESNAALIEQSQAALRQVEDLNRRLTGQAWSEFFSGNQMRLGVDVDLLEETQEYNETWTPELEAALRNNQLMDYEAAGSRIVAVPVRVHGQVIGAMEFELDENQSLTADDRQMIEEVSERFGLAAENARLFEESRRIAQREALINEVGTRLQASSGVETTLVEAARSLQQMLKANRVSIQLGEPPVAQSIANGKDGAA